MRCYYTNADCLLNKLEELEVLISIENPDIIIVTEVFPKNVKPSNIDQNEYKLKGFSCFMGPVTDSCRGVAIYVKDCIKADYCYDLNKTVFKESVWCEITFDKNEKLLIGGVYKSPNCEVTNQEKLCRLITQAVERGCKHTLVVGDFNFPEINWASWTVNTNESHPAFRFVECLRDNYLCKHVKSNTRYRYGQESSCRDLILSVNEEIIENLEIRDKLGASDHNSIIFNIVCQFEKETTTQQRPNFYKGNYTKIREHLSQVDWTELKDKNTEDSWNFL